MIESSLAAFIITYNRPEKLRETIAKLSSQSAAPSLILVVNNGSEVGLDGVSALTKIEQHVMPSNVGPAGAAHWALTELTSRGYAWLQWVDDDDPPRIVTLNERLLQSIKALNDDNIGIIAPVGSYFDQKKGVAVRVTDAQLSKQLYLDLHTVAGNQCMLINADAVRKGALPAKELFFGFEETSFCLAVLKAGFRIVVPADLFKEYRSLSNRWGLSKADIRKTEVPAWRNYYSTRNLIYLFAYKYRRLSTVLMIIVRVLPRSFYYLFSRGVKRGLQEIYYTCRAIFDGLTRRTGLTVLPQKKQTTQ
jgi:GT2 family glycosyltransferase